MRLLFGLVGFAEFSLFFGANLATGLVTHTVDANHRRVMHKKLQGL